MSTRKRRRAPSHRRAAAALVIALATAVAILVSLVAGRQPQAGTALATAPPGTYAITVQATETRDTILARPLDSPGEAFPLAALDHIPGYTTTGSVSPDGTAAALVVADGGSPSRPLASLHFLDLEAGTARRVLTGIEARQVPPWSADGRSVAVTVANEAPAGQGSFTLLRVSLDGAAEEVARFGGVAGVFPFAFDGEGRVLSTVIDRDGSALFRDAEKVASLGPFITRDWVLSPDGSSVAYIEVNTTAGVRYYPRVLSLGAGFRSQSLAASGPQSLGVAWRPGATEPTFGLDPRTALTAGGPGFDVPLAFSPDGGVLAVAHWSGTSYERPGNVTLEAVAPGGRVSLEPATRFLGWAQR